MIYELGLRKVKISKHSDEGIHFYLRKQNERLRVQIFLGYVQQTRDELT